MRDRSAFLYMEPSSRADEFASCGTCANFIRGRKRCYWFSDRDTVDEDDTCGLYVQGTNAGDDTKPSGLSTKKIAGFLEGRVQCKRCNAFDGRDKSRPHCDLYVQLNRIFPRVWRLTEEVKPNACCNAWDKGERNPRNFGPYGPIPDADDPNVGGTIAAVDKLKSRGLISERALSKMKGDAA
jgi:hypothetical protein